MKIQMYSLAEQYREKGFIIIKGFFKLTDVILFNLALRNLIKHHLKEVGIKSADTFNEGLIALDKKDHQRIVAIYETLRDSDALCSIVFYPSLLELIKELLGLGENRTLYMNAHSCRIDPPNDNRWTYKWHQQSYYSIFEADEVQLWTPMVDRNTIEKGTLSVLLGSHKTEHVHYIEKNEAGHEQRFIPNEFVKDKFEEKFIELEPTDIILFHPYLVHRSNPNVSKYVRYSLIASYANPYDPRFRIANIKERGDYHRNRCLPAKITF